MPRRLRLAAALMTLLLVGALSAGAWADQRDARLDRLFARLQSAASGSEARAIEQRIWRIWGEAGTSPPDPAKPRPVDRCPAAHARAAPGAAALQFPVGHPPRRHAWLLPRSRHRR